MPHPGGGVRLFKLHDQKVKVINITKLYKEGVTKVEKPKSINVPCRKWHNSKRNFQEGGKGFSEEIHGKKKGIINKCYYLEEGIKSSLKLKILDIGSLQSTYCQLLVGCSRLEE